MSKKPTRMEQLGVLLTAMVAVIVSGSADLLTGPEPTTSNAIAEATAGTRGPSPQKGAEWLRGGKYYGLCSKVASGLGVRASVVSDVSNGRRSSKRISAAIAKEKALRDSLPAAPARRPISNARAFSPEGKYRGVLTRVARSTGLSLGFVSNVYKGHRDTPRVLEALHAEVARVDAQLAAKKAGA